MDKVKCKHDWDYCESFRLCRKCRKIEDVLDDSILNYEKSGEHLEWQAPDNGKYMTGEFEDDDVEHKQKNRYK